MSISGQNLSIIIVTLKSEQVIDECINSIDPEIPIIIVENSNNLNFKRDCENKYKNVKCILTNKNLGISKQHRDKISNNRLCLCIEPRCYFRK